MADLIGAPASVGFPPNHPPMITFLGVPVRIRGTVFGNLYLTEKRGGGRSPSRTSSSSEALARTAGFVIENARAYGLSERRRQWLEASADWPRPSSHPWTSNGRCVASPPGGAVALRRQGHGGPGDRRRAPARSRLDPADDDLIDGALDEITALIARPRPPTWSRRPPLPSTQS